MHKSAQTLTSIPPQSTTESLNLELLRNFSHRRLSVPLRPSTRPRRGSTRFSCFIFPSQMHKPPQTLTSITKQSTIKIPGLELLGGFTVGRAQEEPRRLGAPRLFVLFIYLPLRLAPSLAFSTNKSESLGCLAQIWR